MSVFLLISIIHWIVGRYAVSYANIAILIISKISFLIHNLIDLSFCVDSYCFIDRSIRCCHYYISSIFIQFDWIIFDWFLYVLILAPKFALLNELIFGMMEWLKKFNKKFHHNHFHKVIKEIQSFLLLFITISILSLLWIPLQVCEAFHTFSFNPLCAIILHFFQMFLSIFILKIHSFKLDNAINFEEDFDNEGEKSCCLWPTDLLPLMARLCSFRSRLNQWLNSKMIIITLHHLFVTFLFSYLDVSFLNLLQWRWKYFCDWTIITSKWFRFRLEWNE